MCWCGYGLVDSRLTVTVYGGDMCSSSNHKLFLETEGAYVAPSVGLILASASPRDESAEAGFWRRYFAVFNSLLFSYGLPPQVLSAFVSVPLFYFFCTFSLFLSYLLQSCVHLFSSLQSLSVIFMTPLNRAKGTKTTPRRIWKRFLSSFFLPL